ncbi:MAG: Gfo/Idh/MocA family oxidoreductase [Thermomicrobiales bacterium]|nr:Gfo/Idh/MocA family oxidoreductase [Thermomicrobiales bacterium]
MSERNLRVGVLGCGQIAQAAHFEAVRKSRHAELHAICDLAEDLVERMALIHNPQRVYTDYAAMLGDPDLDAVIVAIADQFHVAMALQALAAGKHVLVEKPLGVTVEECERLRQEAAQQELIVQVGTMKRFDPGIAFARRFIDDEIGELLALKAWYCDSTHRYAMTDAVQPIIETSAASKRPAGDPKADRRRYYLLGHGSHLLDTARFLGGEIVAIRARLAEKFGAYAWFCEVEFANGALGQLDLTIAVRMDWHEGFQIYGEHGSVIGKTYNPWYFKGSDVECFSERDGQYHRLLGADAHFYRLQLEGFADTILAGAPQVGATAGDGTAAIRGLVAISRSVESGDWVRLADVTGGP